MSSVSILRVLVQGFIKKFHYLQKHLYFKACCDPSCKAMHFEGKLAVLYLCKGHVKDTQMRRQRVQHPSSINRNFAVMRRVFYLCTYYKFTSLKHFLFKVANISNKITIRNLAHWCKYIYFYLLFTVCLMMLWCIDAFLPTVVGLIL